MRQLIITIGTTLLLVGALTACGTNQKTNEIPLETPATHAEKTTSKTNNLEGQDSSTFDAGVHVDWEAVSSPLWNQDIKDKLEATLEAITQKDLKKLNETIALEASGRFDYMIQEHEYNFKKVSEVLKDGRQVLVSIDHDLTFPDGEILKEKGYTYYFEEDEEGQWQLVAID